MSFEELLDHAIDMLRRRGRVTYRALKLHFQLDDDTFDVLKEELLYGQHLARDEEGRVLVWTGPPAPGVLQGTTQTDHSDQRPPLEEVPAAAAVHVPPVPDAERRQLTVMFCDLVDSTALSRQLDPEDLREVIRAYQQTSAAVIQRFDGSIAQYLGDGLLVYFGHPRAHEDDAQRAVRAGLGILEATTGLNTRLAQQYRVRVAVRIGIHTGLVVIGEMGGGGRQERLALGETPNIAARLEALAPPNRVVISHRTRQLVGGAFDLDDLGVHPLKGVAEPMPVYGVRGESAAESRFAAATATGLTPLVGREAELHLLLERWGQAQAGEGQVILLAGEAGIGKSRLTEALRERMAAEPHIRLHYQCSPYATNSAFAPIVGQLERAARFARDDTSDQKLAKLEALLAQATAQVPEVAPLFAALLSIPTGDLYPPLPLSPQRQKTKTIEALVDQLCGLARHRPVLFLWEDAHWSDPTSLEVLDQVVHRVPDQRVLVVITYRPEFVAPWTAAPHVTALTLTRLSRSYVAAMVERLTGGKALPAAVLDQLLVKTDGVPLFVEELTKMVLESGLLRAADGRYELIDPLPPLAIPATLHDALTARLDRLAPVKEVAQIGAAIGREFAAELLAAVAPLRDRELAAALDQLVAAELLFRQGQPPEVRYRFKHALVQEAAYASLLRTRRQQLHGRIAQVLEERFPEITTTEPEVLAHHYTLAGLTQRAVPYWLRAGQTAYRRSANHEAIGHLRRGLTLLHTLPEGPARAQEEVGFHALLGLASATINGYASPEAEQAYTRAHTLCQQLGNAPQLFPVLYGLSLFHWVRGHLELAHTFGTQLLTAGESVGDVTLRLVGASALGNVLWHMGQSAHADSRLTEALMLYDRDLHAPLAADFGRDVGVVSGIYHGLSRVVLGYPDTALHAVHAAVTLARAIKHPFSLCFALGIGMATLMLRRDPPETVLQWAEECITVSAEQGFPQWLAKATVCKGWALGQQDRAVEGLAYIHQGIAAWQAIGAGVALGWHFGVLADTCLAHEQPEQALTATEEAIQWIRTNAEYQFESFVLCQQGKALLALQRADEAEARFRQAITVAQHQAAKWWELRATTGLARLWQQQGKTIAARDLLAPVYGWFTEGGDTADLQEAKALLDQL
jgi:class 3 adenylate cyclase/tetratricopeptide (TPR) repeat protein